jgi:hypothetical protein
MGLGINVDNAGSAYILGQTSSSSFPVTSDAFQTTFRAGFQNSSAFITKLNSAGSGLIYSTFLGGSVEERPAGIGIDADGSAYVTGQTASPDFPVTSGAFQTNSSAVVGGNGGAAFVSKLNPTGSALVYSSFLGNSTGAGGIAVDSAREALIAGTSNNFNGVPVVNPLPGLTNGGAFVAEVNASGTALIYSTYVAASGNSSLSGIALDPAGNAYVVGDIPDGYLQTTPGAFQSISGGATDGFVVSIGAVHLPVLLLSPASLAFPTEVIGSSTSQMITLTNAGNAAMTIEAIIITGDYSQTNTCPLAANSATLAAGANCTITVTFMPRDTGTRAGQLTITDNESSSTHVVNLTGTGNSGVASLSSTSLTFATQQVATTSAAQSVTLRNIGATPLNIASVVATGDFMQTNTCGTSVAAGKKCSINVTFTPTVNGNRTGSVTISDTDPTGAQVISLSGTGLGPAVNLSNTSLAFGNQNVNTTSAAQLVTLSNTGNGALAIQSISTTGQFAQTNNCGSSVAAGNNCTITVTFTPGANNAGNQTGTVTITDNAAGSPHVISLTGVGIGPFSLSSTSATTQTVTAGQRRRHTR